MNKIDFNFLKQNCKLIHSFGLGFIQIKLNEKERVHIYTKKVKTTTHCEEIHDHRYDFKSEIIKGSLINEIFEIDINKDSHFLIKENCSPNKKNENQEKISCGIKKIVSTKMEKGTVYWMDKDVMHRVETDRCITFLTRDLISKDFARVIYPIKHELVCPFSANLSEDQLWQIVKEEIEDVY